MAKAFYKIIIKERLDERRTSCFDGFVVAYKNGVTTITGEVADQAALHGLLVKIRDLGLTLLAVESVARPTEE